MRNKARLRLTTPPRQPTRPWWPACVRVQPFPQWRRRRGVAAADCARGMAVGGGPVDDGLVPKGTSMLPADSAGERPATRYQTNTPIRHCTRMYDCVGNL